MTQIVERRDDMSSNGRLRLIQDDDGDVCVSVIHTDGRSTGVEFCTPMRGGGMSPRTWQALTELVKAMAADNIDPHAQLGRGEFTGNTKQENNDA